MKETDGELELLKEKLGAYYTNPNVELYGNIILKDEMSYLLPVREYDNFFKWCKIIQMLFSMGLTKLGKYKILDAGCGNGQDLRKLIEMGAEPENCYGIDFMEDAIKYAQRKSPATATFKTCNLMESGFENNFFDLILLFNTITNLSDAVITELNSEIRRIIKPDGVLLLMCVLEEKSVLSTGIFDIPARHFTEDEIKKLLSSFDVFRVMNASAVMELPQGGFISDGSKTVDLNVFYNIARQLKDAKKYELLFLEGAIKHLCAGLSLVNNPPKIIALKPK